MSVTINCDMGESYGIWKIGNDEEIMQHVHFINVACGFHAGDPNEMIKTVKLAKLYPHLKIGAHPGLPDLQGFGRREMAMKPDEIENMIVYQVGALQAFLNSEGLPLHHVKPHGSLYNMTARDELKCEALCKAILQFSNSSNEQSSIDDEVTDNYNIKLIGLANSFHEICAKKYKIPFIPEFFADLDYDTTGNLIISRKHDSIDIDRVSKAVEVALHENKIIANDHMTELFIQFQTICIHSDTPNAVEVAKTVNTVLRLWEEKNQTQENNIKILIANRGEIAIRIIRTCEKLKLRTITVYTQEDEYSLHNMTSDESVLVSNYTDTDEILDICKRYGVTALHPGYGFLSENHDFVRRLEKEKIIFIGPRSEIIQNFGLKHYARDLAKQLNIPIIPGSINVLPKSSAEAFHVAKNDIERIGGYPILIKATGGGGGIGMQVCNDDSELRLAIEQCRNKASLYFDNEDVYIEKYYPNSRHIEVQIFGNGAGEIIHLGTRECSIQRRYQKIIEESPAPFFLSTTHNNIVNDLYQCAMKLAKSVNYNSVGTIEFLLVDNGPNDIDTGTFYFLEMNTRLQVEHGITELVNNIDLVEWMLQLSLKDHRSQFNHLLMNKIIDFRNHIQFSYSPCGHSIEARIYAEDPNHDYMPASGLITFIKWPNHRPWLRIDTWITLGTKVTSLYDPLLAKVMVHGNNRNHAMERMNLVLDQLTISGPITNLGLLKAIFQNDHFIAGNTTAKLIKSIDYTPNGMYVLRAGTETTIQDYPGRLDLRVYGIQPCGPMDHLSFQLGNLIVGNQLNTEALEITHHGPRLLFYRPTSIAITGAMFRIELLLPDSKSTLELPMNSKLFIPGGSILDIQSINNTYINGGCRCYLAIFGGINVPTYLNSKSNFTSCGAGGHQGRALQTGDHLPLFNSLNLDIHDHVGLGESIVEFVIPNDIVLKFRTNWEIQVLLGPHSNPDYLNDNSLMELLNTKWKVHFSTNRMGVRLIGPRPKWERLDGGEGGSHPSNIHDSGYALGSVNFTGDMPIILTVEGPTQGGFVCPFTIISSDFWKVGQLKSGDSLIFKPITMNQASEHRAMITNYLTYIKKVLDYRPLVMDKPNYFTDVDDSLLNNNFNKNDKFDIETNSSLLLEYKHNDILIQYRQAGDCYVLIEYGDSKSAISLRLTMRVRQLQEYLGLITDLKTMKTKPILNGLLDSAPAIRSLLIRYDCLQLSQNTLIQYLQRVEKSLPFHNDIELPCRKLHLPIALNDHWNNEAIEHYMKTIRSKASYLPNNLKFIANNNGIIGDNDIDEISDTLLEAQWLVIGIGFYLGCPFAIPINPKHRLSVPKYNPARTYTPDGACGLGGNYMAIYPIESPGGYQLFGRTIQTWSTFGTIGYPFTNYQPWLLNMFDIIQFQSVTEQQLQDLRRLASAGKYRYQITDAVLNLNDIKQLEDSIDEDFLGFKQKQFIAQKNMQRIETQLLQEIDARDSEFSGVITDAHQPDFKELDDNHRIVCAMVGGIIQSISVNVDSDLKIDQTILCTIQAMKTEITIKSDHTGRLYHVYVKPGQLINAGDPLFIIKLD
jgi:urea carboxylase